MLKFEPKNVVDFKQKILNQKVIPQFQNLISHNKLRLGSNFAYVLII